MSDIRVVKGKAPAGLFDLNIYSLSWSKTEIAPMVIFMQLGK